jgi:L-ascorbate metabolism protein UlaG (beta-lactamase superfamily)
VGPAARPGARRVGGTGLKPWSTTRLEAPGKPTITVTATPCRHGPPLSRPIAGAVIGFALTWEGQRDGALWVSGDTVLHGGVRAVADRVPVDVALLHLGAVGFPRAPADVRDQLRWLEPGVAAQVS